MRVGAGENGNRASEVGRARARESGGGRKEGRGGAHQGAEHGRRRSDQSRPDGDLIVPAHSLFFSAFHLVSSRAQSAESRDPGSSPLPLRGSLRNLIASLFPLPIRRALHNLPASLFPLPVRERMKVRVLIQRAILRAIHDSASALNVRTEVTHTSPCQEAGFCGTPPME